VRRHVSFMNYIFSITQMSASFHTTLDVVTFFNDWNHFFYSMRYYIRFPPFLLHAASYLITFHYHCNCVLQLVNIRKISRPTSFPLNCFIVSASLQDDSDDQGVESSTDSLLQAVGDHEFSSPDQSLLDADMQSSLPGDKVRHIIFLCDTYYLLPP
jgi:hypothetical protein